MDVLHAAEARGVRVVNPPRAVEACVDKFLTTFRAPGRRFADAADPRESAGGRRQEAFVPARGRRGRQTGVRGRGRGMQRGHRRGTGMADVPRAGADRQLIYQQRFVPHPGHDFRAFVVGGRVIAAMRRANPRDWRTNVSQGGTATAVELRGEAVELALRAADAVGCPVAGVDLLPGRTGRLWVIEVNAVPAARALSAACNLDVQTWWCGSPRKARREHAPVGPDGVRVGGDGPQGGQRPPGRGVRRPSYSDFLLSALAVGPAFAISPDEEGVGGVIHAAVKATRDVGRQEHQPGYCAVTRPARRRPAAEGELPQRGGRGGEPAHPVRRLGDVCRHPAGPTPAGWATPPTRTYTTSRPLPYWKR